MGHCADKRAFRFFRSTRSISSGRIDIHGLFCAKALIHTGKFAPKISTKLVLKHDAVDDVAFADKVGYKGIFRLIVDLPGMHLLDIAWFITTMVSDMVRTLPDRGYIDKK